MAAAMPANGPRAPGSVRLRVAAVQMRCEPGQRDLNLAHARRHLEHAVLRGAKLVLFPELMPIGCHLERSIWRFAEPFEGLTVAWLRAQACRLRVWIGTSFLETDGRDFFNTFVLMDDDGVVAASVRKNRPAAVESHVFRGSRDRHLVETRLGRVAVGICHEGLRSDWGREIGGHAQLVLLASSTTSPSIDHHDSRLDREAFGALVRGAGAAVASMLGVPTVLAYPCGPWVTHLPAPFLTRDASFPGGSVVSDGRGVTLAALGLGEGLAIADVTLGPVARPVHTRGRWLIQVPRKSVRHVIPGCLGRLSYALSLERRRQARRAFLSRGEVAAR